MVRDTGIVFAALWRRVARGEQPASPLRELPARHGGPDAASVTRRVLLVARSLAPNALAVGLPPGRDVLVVHELVPPGGRARGQPVSSFVIAAIAMLMALVPLGVVLCRAEVMSAVVAYEAIGSVAVLVLVLLAVGFRRSGELELAVLLATALLGSGLVFVRFLERWR